jgi:hypothetical protein
MIREFHHLDVTDLDSFQPEKVGAIMGEQAV